MKEEKKKILGAITSKKLAMLLSASALVLPLAACGKTEKVQIKIDKKELNYCDTSDISADNFINEYVKNYNNGDNSYIEEKLAEYENLYTMLKTDPEQEEQKLGFFDVPEPVVPVTYNFDGTEIPYEQLNNGRYMVADDIIKFVSENSVKIKTLNGEFKIKNDNNSFFVNNTDENNKVETTIEIKPNESCTVSEHKDKASKEYEFNKNGNLISSIVADGKGEFIRKEYKNGNIEVYDAYNRNDFKEETKNEDGSYIIYSRYVEKERYPYKTKESVADVVSYYYDKSDNLEHMDLKSKFYRNDDSFEVYHAKYYPNGDSFEYKRAYDKNKILMYSEKIENKYKQSKTSVISERNEDGKFEDSVYKYDYNLISPCTIRGEDVTGDYSYISRNGMIEVEQKDDIIYHYNCMDGTFSEAYKVDKNGITYYSENGVKTKYINKKQIETTYDESGKITSIKNDKTSTTYYDYEKSIINQISNNTEENITVHAGENEYELGKNGYVNFYEDGKLRIYRRDENYFVWNYEDGLRYEDIDGLERYVRPDGTVHEIENSEER